ncbi:tRNA threonylcarbamoyladenosine biosynthesis protein TsaB [Bhargavaea cecembensis]|uniref:tRNA threonylcarbamoyladenosine biosynthesis protein TsaB n=1 Tax=Bhargavaea cecembensis TaxID=394098 RepID=A0A163G3J2_9BACL|nr:tRNA (adenosine(37)-N6)-threonylcarbamoyltransferase complex dimerization subunit type 1 TsaB [Bhargavaea cecembensis]KZE39661.1 tRNA threonylcarbamoyladenosine biosynthesis protein TsaB [Bhargavaea cecembensis]
MIWLGLDTANAPLSVALVRDGELLVELNSAMGLNHSAGAMPAVEQLFKRAGIRPADIDAIAVSEGPGSYTGVRIGVTIAKTLAWTLDKPLVGVSSLRVLASNVFTYGVTISPLIDARRGNVYAGLYRRGEGDTLECLMEDRHMALSDLLDRLKKEGNPVVFVGEGARKNEEILRGALGELGRRAHFTQDIPRASLLITEAQRTEPEAVHSFVPEYRRITEAEANWRKASGEARGQ